MRRAAVFVVWRFRQGRSNSYYAAKSQSLGAVHALRVNHLACIIVVFLRSWARSEVWTSPAFIGILQLLPVGMSRPEADVHQRKANSSKSWPKSFHSPPNGGWWDEDIDVSIHTVMPRWDRSCNCLSKWVKSGTQTLSFDR